jgi:hypothetical protein
MAGEPIAAVVIELRRYEVQLNIGALVRRKLTSYETAGFRNVAGSGTCSPRASAARNFTAPGKE